MYLWGYSMVLQAFQRPARHRPGQAAPDKHGGTSPRPRWRIGSALCLSLGLLALTPLALALAFVPALAQGRTNKTVTIDGLHDSSLVQLLVTVDKAKTVGCDQEFAEILVA